MCTGRPRPSRTRTSGSTATTTTRGCWARPTPLWGEPRRAGPGEGGTYYEITENLFGAVRAPSLGEPAGSVADAIGSVESELVSGVKTRETFDALPRTLNAVAVADFTRAMTTERLIAFNRRHKICGGEDVSYLYSPSYYDDSASRPY